MQYQQLHPRINAILEARGVDVIVHDHAKLGDISSPQDFADAISMPISRVTKSLFCRTQNGTHYVVIVCGMDKRIDFRRVSKALGLGRLEAADAHELQRLTDYPRNGVSPLGLDADIRVVMDAALLEFSTITIGGGVAGVEIEIGPSDINQIAAASIIDL